MYTGDTRPLESENIFKHTFKTGDQLSINNEGITELNFYLAAKKKGAPVGGIIVGAGKVMTIAAEAIGDIKNTFFNVHNANAVCIGEWTVEKLYKKKVSKGPVIPTGVCTRKGAGFCWFKWGMKSVG